MLLTAVGAFAITIDVAVRTLFYRDQHPAMRQHEADQAIEQAQQTMFHSALRS